MDSPFVAILCSVEDVMSSRSVVGVRTVGNSCALIACLPITGSNSPGVTPLYHKSYPQVAIITSPSLEFSVSIVTTGKLADAKRV